MSIEEFHEKYKGKYSIDLIEKWLKRGYIRGSYENKKTKLWYIPEEALPPYTKRGNPQGISVYKSIIKGVIKGLDVFGELYGMSDLKFNKYIEQLKKYGFLETYESEGITYCMPTINSKDFLRMKSCKISELFGILYEKTLTAVAEGVTNSIVNV